VSFSINVTDVGGDGVAFACRLYVDVVPGVERMGEESVYVKSCNGHDLWGHCNKEIKAIDSNKERISDNTFCGLRYSLSSNPGLDLFPHYPGRAPPRFSQSSG
jgi:hypothetical protein